MKWVRNMLAAILPWPRRAARKAAVADACRLAAEAQEKARQSRSLASALRQMRRRNHVSEALDQLIAQKARER